jgi:aspartate carbamoyltransferase catalytic subunit
MVGDLKYGRTVHSLTKLLSRYSVDFYFVSPEILRMPADLVSEVKARGRNAEEVEDVHKIIGSVDVLYVTRVQKERFTDLAVYDQVKDLYVVDAELMSAAKEDMVIMHPLPRVGEISYAVDKDPRAAYFRQVENGMFIRMALLAAVLGKA